MRTRAPPAVRPLSARRVLEQLVDAARELGGGHVVAAHPVSTPVNWHDGDDVIISPAIADDDAKERFPKGLSTLTPYLRLTPQPNR